MSAAALKRGVALTSRSRPLQPEDWSKFQHVVCMDQENVRAVEAAVSYWKSTGQIKTGADDDDKDGGSGGGGSGSGKSSSSGPRVSLMTDWAPEKSQARRLGKVPDPYYGGPAGFEQVLDLLDEAAEGLVDAALEERRRRAAGVVGQ
jgi:protein-tyrosine phosphatase